jgi:hypothetical protein
MCSIAGHARDEHSTLLPGNDAPCLSLHVFAFFVLLRRLLLRSARGIGNRGQCPSRG